MFCRQCGAQIPEDSTFCTRCGTPVVFTSTAATPPAGEQFFPPPAWPGSPPTVSGWAYPPQPGPTIPPPAQPPFWDRLFGPRLQPGTLAHHRNPVQRRLLSTLSPPVASSSWFGIALGSMCAFAIVLLLSLAFSLILGPTLDQYSADTTSAVSGSLNAGQNNQDVSNTATISHYANPLLVLADANQSKVVEHITENLASDSSLPTSEEVGLDATIAVVPPVSLLLVIPAIGLILGGYLAASTDYTERRLFSIARGASICVLYALGVLVVSLFASGTLSLASSVSGITVTAKGTITPDVSSAALNALLWGAIFGALGGYLRTRTFPSTPHSRLYERIRGALTGAGAALGVYFLLCLLLTIILYVAGQLFTPSLLSQSTTASNTTGSLCSVLAQATSASAHPAGSSDLARYLTFLIGSPAMALWMMTISMGAPIQISGATSLSMGLFGGDCQLGSGGILYALLLIPAAAIFFGGWLAARVTRPRTTQEAAGLGLLLAGALAIALLLFAVLASTTTNESVSLNLNVLGNNIQQSSTQSISEGPAVGSVLLASLLFGCVFSILGSLVGQPRQLPLQPSTPSAWPAPPIGWPPAPPGTAQPVFSPPPGSYPPATPSQGLSAPNNQPTVANPPPPEAAPPGSAPGDAPGPASTPFQTP